MIESASHTPTTYHKGMLPCIADISAQIDSLKDILTPGNVPDVEFLDKYTLSIRDVGARRKIYKPFNTMMDFHSCNDFFRLLMGPFGSGKSTACCVELVIRAITMPLCVDGVRRSRWAVIRNTLGDLEETTLKTWDEEWFGGLGEQHIKRKPILKAQHVFYDEKGPVSIELLFLAMDIPKHVRRFLSLNVTGMYFNEMREIPQLAYDTARGRVGRYPMKEMLDFDYIKSEPYATYLKKMREAIRLSDDPMETEEVWYWKGIFADTNPPEVDSYLYDMLEKDKLRSHTIFKQPPALLGSKKEGFTYNPEAENIKNVGGMSYYLSMAEGADEEYVKVYVKGEYGTIMDGKLVFDTYNDDLHAVERIDIDKKKPIYLGWDFGLTPACLLDQYIDGQRRSILEFTTERLLLRDFVENVVRPWLIKTFLDPDEGVYHFEDNKVFSTGDKSGGEEDEYHAINILNGLLGDIGISTRPSVTNNIQPRLDAVTYFMTRMDKQPMYIVSKSGCPNLRKGYLKRYTYKKIASRSSDPVYHSKPDKTHPWSDIQDCGQYNALRMIGDLSLLKNRKGYYQDKAPHDDSGIDEVGGY